MTHDIERLEANLVPVRRHDGQSLERETTGRSLRGRTDKALTRHLEPTRRFETTH